MGERRGLAHVVELAHEVSTTLRVGRVGEEVIGRPPVVVHDRARVGGHRDVVDGVDASLGVHGEQGQHVRGQCVHPVLGERTGRARR